MNAFNPEEEIKQLICDQMGEDIDIDACEKLKQYMEECPECKLFFDSVNKVVKLYRVYEKDKGLPGDVSRKLFKALNLNKD